MTHQSASRLDRAAYRHQRDIMCHGNDIASSLTSSPVASRACCLPLPLTTQPLAARGDVTVTSPRPRPRPQRMSRAVTMRHRSDDVAIGDVTRRDVICRPCSVSLMASSIGNTAAASSELAAMTSVVTLVQSSSGHADHWAVVTLTTQ